MNLINKDVNKYDSKYNMKIIAKNMQNYSVQNHTLSVP